MKHINLTAVLTVDNRDFSGKIGEAVSTNRTRVFLRPVDDEASDELSSWHLGKIVESTDVLDQIAEILDIDLEDVKIKARDKDGMLPFLIVQGHTGRTLAFDITVNHSEVEDEVVEDEPVEDEDVVATDVENEVEADAMVEA